MATRAPRNKPGRSRTPAFVLALALAGCAAPRPSLEPLGGTSELGPRPPRRENRVARAGAAGNASGGAGGEPVESETTEEDEEATVVVTPVDEAPKGAADAAAPPAEVAGEYVGEDVAVYKVDGIPDRTEKDPKARTKVEERSGGAIDVVIVDSSNGNEICTLDAKMSGATATIRAGQKCFEQSSSEASTSASVKTGTARFEGTRLVVEMDMLFELRAASRTVTGTLDYRFDGKKR